MPIAETLEAAVETIPGWSPLDQLLSLYILAFSSAHLRGDILELGSWCGRSAVALGMAARQTGNTQVHCVDLFPEASDWFENPDGSYSFAVELNRKRYNAYQEQTVWAEPFLRDIRPVYQQFGSTWQAFNTAILKNDLTAHVMPYRMDLEGFAEQAPENFALRMAFIDGDHCYSAVCRDIEIIERFLLPGGWLCFDDAFSVYRGVDQAIEEKIMASGNYSVFQQLTRKCFVAQRKPN